MAKFQRSLSLQSTTAIVVGGVIGSGIFMKPALMASLLGSPLLLLSIWIVAGIITLFGALSNAELAAMFPETGGQLVFFEKIYGRGFAFMYGWASFSVFNTGGNASIAWVCAQYTNYFISLPRLDAMAEHAIRLHIPYIGHIYPLENIGTKILTIVIVALFSLLNYWSLKRSALLQRILTFIKAIAIIIVIGGLFGSGKGNWQHVLRPAIDAPSGMALLGAYVAAIAGAFWAYDGWNNITFIAGEVKQPQRTIPRSLVLGLSFCIVIYALINLAFIYVLPIKTLASSQLVASDALGIAWGTMGGGIIAALVIFSTLGTANANILATSRVTFAMADESRWFNWAGKVQPSYQTPGNALLLNLAWSVVLVLSGSFDMLTDMLIFVSFFFYGMSALGVILLRFRRPEMPRPYKVPAYPLIPAFFVLFAVFFLGYTLYNDISAYTNGQSPVINSVLGIAITAMGIPIYLLSRKTK